MCRWNTLAADNVGVHLQLMPMLLGFLTYKGAVIARGMADTHPLQHAEINACSGCCKLILQQCCTPESLGMC